MVTFGSKGLLLLNLRIYPFYFTSPSLFVVIIFCEISDLAARLKKPAVIKHVVNLFI